MRTKRVTASCSEPFSENPVLNDECAKNATSMALKFKTREEIPAEQVSLYTERDGAWVLDVEGTVVSMAHQCGILDTCIECK